MSAASRSTDPALHQLCIRIARRCVGVIEPLLRQEEVKEALTAFYEAARTELAEPNRAPEV